MKFHINYRDIPIFYEIDNIGIYEKINCIGEGSTSIVIYLFNEKLIIGL